MGSEPNGAHLWVYSLHHRRHIGRQRRRQRDQLPGPRMLELQGPRVQERPGQPRALLQPPVPVFVAVHLVPEDGRAPVLEGEQPA